jgi:hypothetical protein
LKSFGSIKVIYIIILTINIASCKKLVEVSAPPTSINAANVFTSDATAISVVTSLYTKISDLNYDIRNGSPTSTSLLLSLTSDELTLFNLNDPSLAPYYTNNLTSLLANNFWTNFYPLIFTANSTIEGLNNSNTLTTSVKQQLLGEAKFMRAFCYFYLVNIYGDIPLVLTTDYQSASQLPRAPKDQIYRQIITDLTDAQSLLSVNYLGANLLTNTTQRIRPNKWAATALLARVYLYNNDYSDAEIQSTSIINYSSLYNLVALTDVFKMNSTETIWSLQPVRTGLQANTGEGALFILPTTGPNSSDYPVYLSNTLVSAFENGDMRKTNWVDSVKPSTIPYYYSKKYKIGKVNTNTQEYIMVFRLSEQYLIRSEARAQQNNINGAQSDLNVIRARANLAPTSASNKTSLLTAILHERQVEFFTEWGHRWFDLKRTSNIDNVMSTIAPQKGGTWNPYKALFPIPQNEIITDPNLNQNIGY